MDIASLEKRAKEIIDWLGQEFSGIRTGQAAPALLDSVRVSSYGAVVPLNQVGTVGVEDARTLRVSVWDASQVTAVEQAIRDADLGVSTASDSTGLRVIFPELTSDRRTQLARLAKQKHEDARISVRAARDEIMKEIDADEKAGDISEDERHTQRETVQKSIDATNKALDDLLAHKEVEITN